MHLIPAATQHPRGDDHIVAIRVLSNEKETGALRLLMQLPYNVSTLCTTKLAAVLLAVGTASA